MYLPDLIGKMIFLFLGIYNGSSRHLLDTSALCL